jgi:hypothetical protein
MDQSTSSDCTEPQSKLSCVSDYSAVVIDYSATMFSYSNTMTKLMLGGSQT